jgi:hypothetical protein
MGNVGYIIIGGMAEWFKAAVLKIGVLGEEGYPREKNPFAPRRPDFSWLHKDRYQAK